MDLGLVWQDFGLDKLEEGMRTLFPQSKGSQIYGGSVPVCGTC